MEHTHHHPAENAEPKIETTDVAPVSELVKNEPVQMDWVKKMNPKYVWIGIVVIAVAALLFYNKSLFVAATVDGHVISRLKVIEKLEKQGGKSTLDTLISNQLVDNEAAAKKITVSDDEVNAQIKKITSQIEAQGGTLDSALTQAGITMDDLKSQIINELKIEKLLGDKIAVADSEVDKYIADNKVTLPAGQEAATKDQIKDQLKQTKVSAQASQYLADLRLKAKIKTYVKY